MTKSGNRWFIIILTILLILLTASVLGLIFLRPIEKAVFSDVRVAIDFASFENGATYEDMLALSEQMSFAKNPMGAMFFENVIGTIDGVVFDFERPEHFLDFRRLDWEEEEIRECEVVCLRFRYGGEEKECYCLYDYETFEEYAVRDGNLYEIAGMFDYRLIGGIVDRPEYDRLLKGTDSGNYKGDSYEVGTFRYRRHFFTTRHPETASFSGFNNKTKVTIESDEQVLELALSEMDYPNMTLSGLYYDKLSGYYLVRLTKAHPRHLPGDPTTHLFTFGAGTDVIIDGNGVTKEIVPNNGAYWRDHMKYKNS